MEKISIGDFFRYLKRYIVVFVVVVVLAVAGTVAYDTVIKKPIYQAQTTVVIANTGSSSNSAVTLNDVNASQKLAANYSEIAKSGLVLGKVIENLGLRSSANELNKSVTVKPLSDTSIIQITVKNPDAKLSAMIANEIVEVSTDVISDIYKMENTTQLSAAVTPSVPSNNSLTRDVVLAGVIAVLLVAGFAFLKYYFDDSLKFNEEIERTIGLPVTGRISKGDIRRRDELVTEKLPKAIVSENFRSLRTNLQFTSVDKNLETILVTSPNAGEGKSFVAANLAISFAQTDKRVLLVDCDLRRGRVHRLFNLSNSKGLSNLLTEDLKNFSKYIYPTKLKNLNVITCGTYPPSPSELLASKKNRSLVKLLCNYFDVVIFDGAPIEGLADSVIMSSFIDETLIVVKNGATRTVDLLAAKDALSKVGAKTVGVVFNMVNRSSHGNSYYYGNDA